MKRVLISEFKTHCISLLRNMAVTGEGIIVTLRGKPVAKVVPYSDQTPAGVVLGRGRGTAKIAGDIVNFTASEDWEVMKD